MDNNYNGGYQQQPQPQPQQPVYQQPMYQQPMGAPMGQPPMQPINPNAKTYGIVSLICGIASCVVCWISYGAFVALILAIVGLVFAVKGRNGMPIGADGRGIATAGLVLSIIGLVLSVICSICIACVICAGKAIEGGLNEFQNQYGQIGDQLNDYINSMQGG